MYDFKTDIRDRCSIAEHQFYIFPYRFSRLTSSSFCLKSLRYLWSDKISIFRLDTLKYTFAKKKKGSSQLSNIRDKGDSKQPVNKMQGKKIKIIKIKSIWLNRILRRTMD